MVDAATRVTRAVVRALAAALLASTGAAGGAGAEVTESALAVPITDLRGGAWTMPGRVCRPAGARAARVVVINHGSTSDPADRRSWVPASCSSAPAKWFTDRGFAVVFVMRLGHGPGDSPWTESFHCTAEGFYQSGMETARQIAIIVDAARRLPNVVADDAVVIGVSAGGWGTIALDARAHPGVAAFINVSGGRGGHYRNVANSNCHPDALVEAAGRFGKTATTPMLFVYARNDSYFGPTLARSLHTAFSAAGAQADFVLTPPFGDDGHALFGPDDGVAAWGPAVEAYLIARRLLPATARDQR